MVSLVRNHLQTVTLRAAIPTSAPHERRAPPAPEPRRTAAPSYPMSADEASGTTTWGDSGTTGGSTSSR